MRALVIDDSSSMRAILQQYMRKLNYEVVVACNGQDALKRCEETHHIEAALSAGANEFVMKPFTYEVLEEKIALLNESM
jgi:CheY-like chemotaxis protein